MLGLLATPRGLSVRDRAFELVLELVGGREVELTAEEVVEPTKLM